MSDLNPITTLLAQLPQFDAPELASVSVLDDFSSTAAHWTRLRATLDGVTQQFLLKQYRSDWFYGGLAEIRWYEQLAGRGNRPVSPPSFGSVVDEAQQTAALLLSDMGETHTTARDWPYQPSGTQPLERAVASLAALHAAWWDAPILQTDPFQRRVGGPLVFAHATTPDVMAAYHAMLEARLPALAAQMAPQLTQTEWQFVQAVVAQWPILWQARVANQRNLTLIHGDAHAWNMFFPKHESAATYLVDWETYKPGLGVYDLAYLLVSSIEPARRALLEPLALILYRQGLQDAGITAYSEQALQADYRLALLANLFPPLLWRSVPKLRHALQACRTWACAELLG